MYGDTAHKLIVNAKRAQCLDKIPLYEQELVRVIIRESNELEEQGSNSESFTNNDDTDRTNKLPEFVRGLCMSRNKRCLLGYEKQRIDTIDDLVWSNVEIDKEQLDELSHHEQEYLSNYNELVSAYKGLIPDVDLGGKLEPPNDVFIDVRVLKDAGEIQTEYGVFNLTKDSQFFVRQADVERLIQQGFLKKLN